MCVAFCRCSPSGDCSHPQPVRKALLEHAAQIVSLLGTGEGGGGEDGGKRGRVNCEREGEDRGQREGVGWQRERKGGRQGRGGGERA